MTFPASSTQISTDNLDAGTDNPSLARADLYQAVTLVNDIIASQDTASGVAILDANGKIPATRLPQTIALTGTDPQSLAPESGVVEINNILRLSPQLKIQVTATNTATLMSGSVAYCLDGTTASTACLVIWNGSVWKTLEFTGNL